MSGPVVLSVGSINADFQIRVDGLEDFGQALRAGRELARLSGGKAANVAVLARRLGCQARLLGRVGDDDLARQALEPLRREGVDLGPVRRAASAVTGFALLAVGPDGDKRSVSAGGANTGFGAAMGPAAVCIKRRSGGCLVLHEGRSWHQPAAPPWNAG